MMESCRSSGGSTDRAILYRIERSKNLDLDEYFADTDIKAVYKNLSHDINSLTSVKLSEEWLKSNAPVERRTQNSQIRSDTLVYNKTYLSYYDL